MTQGGGRQASKSASATDFGSRRLGFAGNIKIADGKPLFLHKCEQCMACIQWCPKSAIILASAKKKNYFIVARI
jgi:Pyruvate/2-oxoacid:ferredoxin oxidoreductase delta subunit